MLCKGIALNCSAITFFNYRFKKDRYVSNCFAFGAFRGKDKAKTTGLVFEEYCLLPGPALVEQTGHAACAGAEIICHS